MKRSTEDILLDLEGKINSKMREFNNILYPDIRKTPQINFKDHNNYSFYTPDDDGTGTKFKGMILFDLSMLYLTKLPALTHDSLLLNNINYQATISCIYPFISMFIRIISVHKAICLYPDFTFPIIIHILYFNFNPR